MRPRASRALGLAGAEASRRNAGRSDGQRERDRSEHRPPRGRASARVHEADRARASTMPAPPPRNTCGQADRPSAASRRAPRRHVDQKPRRSPPRDRRQHRATRRGPIEPMASVARPMAMSPARIALDARHAQPITDRAPAGSRRSSRTRATPHPRSRGRRPPASSAGSAVKAKRRCPWPTARASRPATATARPRRQIATSERWPSGRRGEQIGGPEPARLRVGAEKAEAGRFA